MDLLSILQRIYYGLRIPRLTEQLVLLVKIQDFCSFVLSYVNKCTNRRHAIMQLLCYCPVPCKFNAVHTSFNITMLLTSRLLSKNLKIKIYRTIILPVVLYGCEAWSLTLLQERKLRVFENMVLRRIF